MFFFKCLKGEVIICSTDKERKDLQKVLTTISGPNSVFADVFSAYSLIPIKDRIFRFFPHLPLVLFFGSSDISMGTVIQSLLMAFVELAIQALL